MTADRPGARHLSLQYRLPLLITGLLFAVVVTGSLLAYNEVRSTTVMARGERLENVARQLATIVEGNLAERIDELNEVATAPGVQVMLRSARAGRIPEEANDAVLEPLVSSSDSLPVELRNADGASVLRHGSFPAAWTPAQIDSARAVLHDAAVGGYTEIFAVGGRSYVWVSVPVKAGEQRLGEIAHLRAVGSPNGARTLGSLIGGGSTIYFTNLSGGDWTTLTGERVAPAFVNPAAPPSVYQRADTTFMARAAAVGATPLAFIVESPMDEVLAGPNRFLRRGLIGAVLLAVLSAAGAWLVSRSITRPLKQLAGAAEGLAAGDYSRRVHVDRNDELGALARAFSLMRTRVQATQDALREQLHGARTLASRLETTNTRLTDAMVAADQARAKSDFLATMSHEIRTPINAIVGYADLMQMEIPGPLTDDQRNQLDRIRASGAHLITLVDEVLDLARIESGRMTVADQVCRTGDAISSALAVVLPEARRKGLQVERSGNEDILYQGDPQRVRQVLINLLSNAVKFTGAVGRIEIRVARTEPRAGDSGDVPWAAISISDTGVGIAPDKLEQVFEPFVQGDRGYTRAHGGVGLGLAISRNLARMMGGDVDVVSEPGRGSTFTLRLPLAAGSEARV